MLLFLNCAVMLEYPWSLIYTSIYEKSCIIPCDSFSSSQDVKNLNPSSIFIITGHDTSLTNACFARIPRSNILLHAFKNSTVNMVESDVPLSDTGSAEAYSSNSEITCSCWKETSLKYSTFEHCKPALFWLVLHWVLSTSPCTQSSPSDQELWGVGHSFFVEFLCAIVPLWTASQI